MSGGDVRGSLRARVAWYEWLPRYLLPLPERGQGPKITPGLLAATAGLHAAMAVLLR